MKTSSNIFWVLLLSLASVVAKPADETLRLPRPDAAEELYVVNGYKLRKQVFDPRAEIVLFFYSASWCPNCKQMGKAMEAIYPSIRSDYPQIQLVTFSMDRSTRERAEYLRSTDFPWPAIGPEAATSVDWQLEISGGIPQFQAFKLGPDRLTALTAPGAPADVLQVAIDYLEKTPSSQKL